MKRKYRCPCCGYYTFEERIENTFVICPVCFWEDDGIQLFKPEYKGGANDVSLNQARRNFKIFGTTEKRVIEYVRGPHEDELKGIDWIIDDDYIKFLEE